MRMLEGLSWCGGIKVVHPHPKMECPYGDQMYLHDVQCWGI